MSKIEEILNEFGGVVYYEQLPDRHKKAIAQLRALVDEVRKQAVVDCMSSNLGGGEYARGVSDMNTKVGQLSDQLFGESEVND